MEQTPAVTPLPVPLRTSSGDSSPVLLTPRDAARTLAISERTLWSLTKRGEVASVRFGRAVRYDAVDLQLLVDRSKAVPR